MQIMVPDLTARERDLCWPSLLNWLAYQEMCNPTTPAVFLFANCNIEYDWVGVFERADLTYLSIQSI